MRFFRIGLLTLFVLLTEYSWAGEVLVAVAANFSAPAKVLAEQFERDTGHKALLSVGSTGSLYAQIRNGAPFGVLLSADDETPKRAEQDGLGVKGTRFTYAIGKLVLWSAEPGVVDTHGEVLKRGQLNRLALANPKSAPYGQAAMEVMERLNVRELWSNKWVQGENIAQAHQFVSTGNAPLGFVALSQVFVDGKIKSGSAWVVPQSLYTPILQDALLLTAAKDPAAAKAFLSFLRTDRAKSLIQQYGYELPTSAVP